MIDDDYRIIISQGLGFAAGERDTGGLLLGELDGSQVLVLGLKQA
jgi:hypothetical protein